MPASTSQTAACSWPDSCHTLGRADCIIGGQAATMLTWACSAATALWSRGAHDLGACQKLAQLSAFFGKLKWYPPPHIRAALIGFSIKDLRHFHARYRPEMKGVLIWGGPAHHLGWASSGTGMWAWDLSMFINSPRISGPSSSLTHFTSLVSHTQNKLAFF